jgi:hypothetical protein
MADEVKSLPASLFETIRPDLASVPLVVSSDVLVMMLRLVDSLRLLLLVPAIESSPVSQQIKATVQDLENRIGATMNAIDELAEMQEIEER